MAKKSALQKVGAKGRLPAPTGSAAVVASLEDAERESLRGKAREHTDTMLDVLVKTAKGKKQKTGKPVPANTRRLAANDVLVWGYGRPAISQERAEADDGSGMTIIIGELHVDGQPRAGGEEIDVTPVSAPDVENPEGFEPIEFDIEALADAPVKP
jgi:hypothetical protein